MNINYQKAKRYVMKCGFEADFVHDAYIKWWEKTGNNLFLEKEHTVIKVVKNIMFNSYQKYDSFVQYGERVPRITHEFITSYLVQGNHTEPNQYSAMALSETRQKALSLTGTTRLIYDWAAKGYTAKEISQIVGISPQLVTYHRKRIKTLLN